MKKYVKASTIHLKDILDKIRYVVVTDDITQCNFGEIYASEDTDDEYYLTIPSNRLAQVPEEELANITNLFVLDRIAQIDKSKLSIEQLNMLRDEYKKKVDIDDTDRKALLEMFRDCNRVTVENRRKNNDFINEYDLDSTDILAILHNLKLSDFDKKTRSINYGHLGNNLIILKPSILIPRSDVMINAKLYVKLDIDYEDRTCAAFISIHPEGTR